MSVERPTGPAEPGHPGKRLFALALRIALIAGAATAAYLALALLDRPAYAEDRPAGPGLIGGVIDVVTAVPRSLAGSGPSAGDRTEDARDAPYAPGAVVDPPRLPRDLVTPSPAPGAATTPAHPSTARDARRSGPAKVIPAGRSGGRSSSARASSGPREAGPPKAGPARGSHGLAVSSVPPPPTDREHAGLGAVVSGLTDAVGRTVEGTTGGLADALPLPAALTGPILVDAPAAVVDLVDAVVDVGLDTTETVIPPAPGSPLSPNPGSPLPPTPTEPVTATPSAPGGSTPVAPVRTRPPPVSAEGSGSAGGMNPACCGGAGVHRPGSTAAARAFESADHRAAPPPSAPVPFGDGVGGSGNGATAAGATQLQALPAISPWRADPVLVSTSRLADAVRCGRSPAVPALPG